MIIATKWTIDEYHSMIAAGILDDRKVELLKGDIIEMSPKKNLILILAMKRVSI